MCYSIFSFITMYYSLLKHITAYIIVLQFNIVRSCTLASGILVYSMFHYIKMHHSVFQSETMYYSL